MTAKRFNYVAFDGFEDNGEYITPYQVCELLNELHGENEQLKKEKESLIKGIKDTAKQGADSITAVWESKNRPTTINKGYYD